MKTKHKNVRINRGLFDLLNSGIMIEDIYGKRKKAFQ